jgi:NADPH:quinone reductase-like Zn-dependent oxidoreductase
VLIHGASGGVGAFAVQFAKHRGAQVLATGKGREAREFLRGLDVDEAIDTEHDDVLAAMRRIAPEGVDALLALIGGPELERALKGLRAGAVVAHPNGVDVPPSAAAVAFDGVPNPAAFARLSATIDAAPIDVPIAATYSLVAADEAHRRLERGHVFGKIILVVDATEDVVEKVA